MSPTTAAMPVSVDPLSKASRSFAVVFLPDLARVAQMRRITSASLRSWNLRGPVAADVVLAVSELVTNAVQHGSGDVGLLVRCSGCKLRVEVTDGSPGRPVVHYADDDDVSGRGLFLVSVLAQDWGVSDDGLTTWCEFRLPAGRP
ncbi:ATP-binding protein [Streptomyces sp. NPDC002055]|uniref:ATP-binding protein n=1 Tax=Streptomyces sp. NPDC002055 TaxID=3154534 RepID=UPI0033250CE4